MDRLDRLEAAEQKARHLRQLLEAETLHLRQMLENHEKRLEYAKRLSARLKDAVKQLNAATRSGRYGHSG